LADLFSVSVSSIKKWDAEGFPVKGELKEQIAWVRANRPIASHAITEARTRKINAEARLKELELMIKEGELVQRSEVLEHIKFIILETKNRFWLLRRTLPPKLSGRDSREWGDIIKAEVRQILENFSKAMRKGARKG